MYTYIQKYVYMSICSLLCLTYFCAIHLWCVDNIFISLIHCTHTILPYEYAMCILLCSVILKNSSVTILVYFPWYAWAPVSQGLYLEVELLDHRKFLPSNSLVNTKLFSEVAIPIYTHSTGCEHSYFTFSPSLKYWQI